MKIHRISKILGASIISLLMLISVSSSVIGVFEKKVYNNGQQTTYDSLPYDGRLIVYVVEPESRWNMYNGQPYHYACVDFAIDDDLSINYLDTYQNSVTWDGDVTEQNVIVIAAVFGPDVYQSYAYPPAQNPFNAYPVDAGAGAHPGETAYNTVNEDFTHTVIVEEGTATWCQYCPDMAEALYGIYQSGDYPYYFVALVDDKFPQGAQRLDEMNLYGFPTAFFDGGYKVYVGGNPSQTPYRQRIEQSGERDAHDLNLSLSVTWLGSGDLQIDVSIFNNEESFAPNTPPAPIGPENGRVGIQYTYNASTTDPDGDELFYYFDWGDGSNSGWIGPFDSGSTAHATHVWDEEGNYEVKVRAKDRANHITDYSDSLSVQIDPPEFVITPQSGTSFLKVSIMNNCEETLPEVDWNIHVTGGILKLIDVQTNGVITSMEPGEEKVVQTNRTIFGLGRLNLEMTIDTTLFEAQGFIFGPIIIFRG